ncbi:MAG: cob(I)yrinic acid a,c-diamide adenosyltransferase [Actinomycetota bacterium]
MKKKKGLVLVNTGDGKGKTTAAFGLALRAAGHNLRVLILQFIKGPWVSGEVKACRSIPHIVIKQLGSGFIKFKDGRPDIDQKLIEEAEKAIAYAKEEIGAGKYDLIILDEINNMVDYGLVDADKLVDIIEKKPKDLILVLTGRNVDSRVAAAADTVTEMREVKHAFGSGIKAIKGIEY